MKKLMWYSIMLIVVIMSAVFFTSCNNDKFEESGIVGMWTMSGEDYSESYTFSTDNSFTCVAYTNNECVYNAYGTYVYTASKNELILTDSYASEKQGTHKYTVQLSNNSLILIEEDGDVDGPYVKQ